MNMKIDARAQQAMNNVMDFFGKHLVGIVVQQQYRDGRKFWSEFSGFLFRVGRGAVLVTAGHALKDLDDPDIVSMDSELFVFSGGEARSMPFQYESAVTVHVDNDDGIDLGVMVLSEEYIQQLAANGVVPFDPNTCGALDGVEEDIYAVIGVPGDFSNLERGSDGRVTGTTEPHMVFVDAVDLDTVPEDFRTKYREFTAKLAAAVEPDFDMAGMSGGAIIRIRATEAGGKYWLIAIQSAQAGRLVFGCPIQRLYELLEACVEEYRKSRKRNTALEVRS